MSFFYLNKCNVFLIYVPLPLRFIIELCEPIQLKQLDIANFELFSSTPKDFLVSISDRYASYHWHCLVQWRFFIFHIMFDNCKIFNYNFCDISLYTRDWSKGNLCMVLFLFYFFIFVFLTEVFKYFFVFPSPLLWFIQTYQQKPCINSNTFGLHQIKL